MVSIFCKTYSRVNVTRLDALFTVSQQCIYTCQSPEQRQHSPPCHNMTGVPLSPPSRSRVAEAARSTSFRAVACRFGCSVSTVARCLDSYVSKGHNYTANRTGRPPKVTPCLVDRMQRLVLAPNNRFMSLQEIVNELRMGNVDICVRTLQRILDWLKIKRCIPRSKPFLTNKAQKTRLLYAKDHREEELQEWRRTIFVDEASICL